MIDLKYSKKPKDGLVRYWPAAPFEVDGIRYTSEGSVRGPMFQIKPDLLWETDEAPVDGGDGHR